MAAATILDEIRAKKRGRIKVVKETGDIDLEKKKKGRRGAIRPHCCT